MNPRIGHGYDLHRLQTGGRLMLAGVEVSREISPVAHSDGDVVLHALVDALLGAMGLGDIGLRFPNTDPLWAGADSSVFVTDAMNELQMRRGQVINIDVTILAERPRLAPFREAMRERLRVLTGSENINVKFGTNEGVDAIGRGEAIAAHVVVLIAIHP
jgi:2-C-methyl-D-erythritol 2,4-cyclodiphosphate synthase